MKRICPSSKIKKKKKEERRRKKNKNKEPSLFFQINKRNVIQPIKWWRWGKRKKKKKTGNKQLYQRID